MYVLKKKYARVYLDVFVVLPKQLSDENVKRG